MLNRNFRQILLLLFTAMLLASPALAYKKVKCFMPQAPDINLQGMKRVAILDFESHNDVSAEAGRALADLMIEFMLMEDRGISAIHGGLFGSKKGGVTLVEGLSTRCFDVVERSRMEAVISELKLGQTGIINESEASQIGEVLGVDFIIMGTVSAEKTDRHSREIHSKVRNKKKITFKVDCIKRKVSVSASIRIVDAKTGKILDTRRAYRKLEDKWCSDRRKDLRDDGEMAGTCVALIAWEFTNMINPWYELEVFELDKIKIKEFKKEADVAALATQKYELRKAYVIFKKLFDNDPYNPKYLYNLGILYEISGDFEMAKEMFDGAAMLKDDKRYKRAAERIARRTNLVPFYASLDMAIVPVDFESAADDKSLFTEFVKMRGKSQKRYPVYQGPANTSGEVVRIPGEIRLEVLAIEGDWYKIKLPIGGKIGYVHKDQIKK